MSYTLTLNFDNYELLCDFISDMNKFKNWKSKQEIKKKNQTKDPIEINDDLVEVLKTDVQDKRGLHQQQYHNQAKLYQNENPHLSYREALQYVYKNIKNI